MIGKNSLKPKQKLGNNIEIILREHCHVPLYAVFEPQYAKTAFRNVEQGD
jgi:hypothetical protein